MNGRDYREHYVDSKEKVDKVSGRHCSSFHSVSILVPHLQNFKNYSRCCLTLTAL